MECDLLQHYVHLEALLSLALHASLDPSQLHQSLHTVSGRVEQPGVTCQDPSTLGCLISDPIRYILIKEKMHLIGSTLRVFSRNLPWTPMACNWSIPDIPSIPGIV